VRDLLAVSLALFCNAIYISLLYLVYIFTKNYYLNMPKGFRASKDNNILGIKEKTRILQKLKEEQDTILGFFWKNYLEHGNGAVIVRALEDAKEIKYRPEDEISDYKDLKVVQENNPDISAVVFVYFKNEYLVTTLIGPKTPPDCYKEIPSD
jgi:hypothetical protein